MSKALDTVRVIVDRLDQTYLPDLERPAVADSIPESTLVAWGIKVYAYSVVAHVREILRDVVGLRERKRIPALYIIGRHVFEWAAHTCFLQRTIERHVKAQDWAAAWALLTQAVLGNLWIRKQEGEFATKNSLPLPEKWPTPISVRDAKYEYAACQEERGEEGHAGDDYGHLSEFSHANAAALQHYHDWKSVGGKRLLHFTAATSPSPMNIISASSIDILMFVEALLGLAVDMQVRGCIVGLLKEVITVNSKA